MNKRIKINCKSKSLSGLFLISESQTFGVVTIVIQIILIWYGQIQLYWKIIKSISLNLDTQYVTNLIVNMIKTALFCLFHKI